LALDLSGSLSIQPFEGSRFVRGGRYGISIDFGLEVVAKNGTCGVTFISKFIDLTMNSNSPSPHRNPRESIPQDSER
jgi:hypothetical protein